MVKVGDKVNATGTASWISRWQDCTVVEIYPCGNLLVTNPSGVRGELGRNGFEIVTPTPEPTDQELADEFRQLREKATAIAVKLYDRGYTGQLFTNPQPYWRDAVPPTHGAKFRFTKTETTTTTVTL